MAMIDSIETTDQVLARVSGRARRARKIAEVASWNLENLVGEDGLETAVIGATAETMAAQDRDGFKPQTLIAPKTKWDSLDAARNWAKEHGYRVDKVDDTPQAWCFRQRDPGDFKQLRTICINPGPDTAPTMDASKMLMVGGLLKEGVVAAFHDPEAEGVDEFLTYPRKSRPMVRHGMHRHSRISHPNLGQSSLMRKNGISQNMLRGQRRCRRRISAISSCSIIVRQMGQLCRTVCGML
jgi:hypothetical protein